MEKARTEATSIWDKKGYTNESISMNYLK
jgi:hypothetical protein